MKNTRKLLAAVMALAMVSAIAPMSAFAVDDTVIKQDSTTKSGTMTATYDVTAKYTVTIPAGVTLDSTNAVSKKIEASDVMLESGKKITVKLTGASNTASGASFSAKTTKGDSTATYTIGKGEATTGISVGDTVAEFTENGTQALTFSKAEGATYAGTHTETLTFGIAVEDAATVPVTVNTSLGIGTSSSQSIQFKKITVYYTENGSTEEKSESFTTTGATSFTGEKFKITAASGYVDDDGVAMEQNKPINIESLNGENITKVDLTVGYYGGRSSYIRTTPSTTISGNDSVGGTITLKL